MSILSDADILEHMMNGLIEIYPIGPTAIRPASVDLRLGALLTLADPNEPDGWRVHDLRESPFRLYPGAFVLGHTLERVRIGNTLAGVLAGKSSRAREGLILESAGYVDPGWDGELTVEMAKLGPGHILLTLGMPIGQIRFETLLSPCEKGYGDPSLGSHYQGSRGPVPSRTSGRTP